MSLKLATGLSLGSAYETQLVSGWLRGSKLRMMPSTPPKTHPSCIIRCQCALLHTQAVLLHLPSALSLVAGEGLGAGHLLCLTAPLLPVSAGTWWLQKSFTLVLHSRERPDSSGRDYFTWGPSQCSPASHSPWWCGCFVALLAALGSCWKTWLHDQQGAFPTRNVRKPCWIRCLFRSSLWVGGFATSAFGVTQTKVMHNFKNCRGWKTIQLQQRKRICLLVSWIKNSLAYFSFHMNNL